MPLPDNTLPPNPRHDADAALAAHKGSPAPARRLTLINLLISIACCPVILFGTNLIYLVATCIGIVASALATVFAIIAIWKTLKPAPPARMRSSMTRCVQGAIAAIVFLVFNGWSCNQLAFRLGQRSLTTVAQANLMGIAQATVLYREQFHDAPRDIESLIAANFVTPKTAMSPNDRRSWPTLDTPAFKPSFVFIAEAATGRVPGGTLLAYEREPWSSERLQLFPIHRHLVAYVDGSTNLLTPTELSAVLAKTRSVATSPPR